ncbi:AAA family ATPase [Haloarchaeobius sp. HRN-SO-5]|uniref:AAA family ATPase n=1 Tax=Haloarchaeobius sp. HRN-SO-5 TaxID=3446118 RepID=UPI003EBB1100
MEIREAHDTGEQVLDEVTSAVIADRRMLRTTLTGLFARGHVLLEDVPGTGKTLTARSFANALGLSFNRVQFTPDLLPSDVTGTSVFNEQTREFQFSEGPIFANVVLADEINRASPKTQAALLEAMDEKQVTVDGETHDLPNPFFVIATQNPVEQGQGTFSLPEAQKDRFLVKLSLGYPDRAGELELLNRRESRRTPLPEVGCVVSPEQVPQLQDVPEEVRVDPDLKEYIVDVVHETRADSRVEVGVSPRGCQRLFEAVRAYAVLDGRDYVIPDDVKDLGPALLSHRIMLTPDAMVDNVKKSDVIGDVFESVGVPTVNRAAQR